jgi:hypothetical protein
MTPDAETPDAPRLALDEREAELEAELLAVRAIKDYLPKLAEALRRFPHLKARFETQLRELTAPTPVAAPPRPVIVNEPAPAISFAPMPTFDASDPPESPEGDGPTIAEKVVAFFSGRENRPATTAEMRAEITVRDSSLRNLLYAYEGKKFERVGKVKGGLVLWKLTDQAAREPTSELSAAG